MIQDPSSRYITTILSQCDLSGKDVLEIGCGKGRITRDLVKHAKCILATDPDADALAIARTAIDANNVEFLLTPTGIPEFHAESFDVVIYTLSLHHVPTEEMSTSLNSAATLIRKDGIIVVVEPGAVGSFTEAEERFGAGCGNERSAKAAVIRTMNSLEGWAKEETIIFRTQFQFDNDVDFLANMLPGYRQLPEHLIDEVRDFLHLHQTADGIILDADRRLNVLRRL